MQKIPFHIISGFLGSGKTTFLKQILGQIPAGEKIGVVQNEFAPANIDGTELKQAGRDFQLLELNNGSVFCACLLGDFVDSLNRFVDRYQPDLVVLEASGLSDPTSVAETLSLPPLSEKIYLAGNWCVVDTVNFNRGGLMRQRIIHQVRAADVVLLNKADLAGDKISGVKAEIRQINPFADLRETSFGQAFFQEELQPVKKFYFDRVAPLGRPDIQSMVIKSGKRLTRDRLEKFLNQWAPLAYRIKGFVALADGASVAVQCTLGTVEIKPVEWLAGPTELVALTDQFTLPEWNRSFREYAG